MDITFVPTAVIGASNLLLTLLLQYVPGLRVWWAVKTSEVKKSVFLFGGVAIAVVWFVATLPALGLCTPEIGFVCTPTTASALVSALVALLVGVGGMDGFFNVLPETKDVIVAKATRNGGAG